MSTTYAGTPTYPTEITVPDDGDNKPAASVGVGLEGLADRTAFLQARSVEETGLFVSEAMNPPGILAAVVVATPTTTLGTVEFAHCAAGDELLIDASGTANGLAGCAALVFCDVDEKDGVDTTNYTVASSKRWVVTDANDAYFGWAITARHVVNEAGPTTVKLLAHLLVGNGGGGAPAGGDAVQFLEGVTLRVVRRRAAT